MCIYIYLIPHCTLHVASYYGRPIVGGTTIFAREALSLVLTKYDVG